MQTDLNEITVWEHELTFSEDKDCIPGQITRFELFPVNLQQALDLLKKAGRERVKIRKVNEKISQDRLNDVILAFKNAGITVY